ncbi:hypothetical protein Pla52o_05920 [Novipirellula galeiformis]|uniref:Outer membrane protein assembly factor BamD n=1 Tax=Novipirellula galeiformis TaxID=2528004 RepID=A0A5C6CVJ8_9BACT|nr:tetratricopeptide repeat protein [Novipirellula galeiformis]TWU26739.1 hypothetical protein Pla52o_05920 [Novipirellula galeiformis]
MKRYDQSMQSLLSLLIHPSLRRRSFTRIQSTERIIRRCSTMTITAWTLIAATGCQSWTPPPSLFPAKPSVYDIPDEDGVRQTSAESSFGDTARKNTTRVMNFVTLREQENVDKAKDLYKQGDTAFRQAGTMSGKEAKTTFHKAAKLFRRANEASPGTALQQDAMFMQAESLFFADRLSEASEAYTELQKTYPRNRHNDRITARLFNISRYWIETEKATENDWKFLNLTDHKRPVLDADGHAIRVLDQIRYDDPTGKLADDATMAAAAEHIRQGKFEKADEFLTDLRETYTDSDHLFMAHLLGIRCKLEMYAGPDYSGLVLEEAEKIVQQTRTRFPDKLQDEKYNDIVARAAAEISFHHAERLASRARFRENKKEYGAARYYYQQLLTMHQDTPHAETARTRLAEIEKLPDVPTPRLSWLTTVFPDSKSSTPLETTFEDGSKRPESEGATMLR